MKLEGATGRLGLVTASESSASVSPPGIGTSVPTT